MLNNLTGVPVSKLCPGAVITTGLLSVTLVIVATTIVWLTPVSFNALSPIAIEFEIYVPYGKYNLTMDEAVLGTHFYLLKRFLIYL